MAKQIKGAYVLRINWSVKEVLLKAVAVAKSVEIYIPVITSVGSASNEIGSNVADSSSWLGDRLVDITTRKH